MKKNKLIGLALLGATGLIFMNKEKPKTGIDSGAGGGFTPITTGTDTLPNSSEDVNTSVSGFEFTKDAVEFSKEQYANMRRAEWRIVLYTKLAQGKSVAIATQEIWELWDNPGNPLRLVFNSPTSLLLNIIVQPTTSCVSIGAIIEWNSIPVYPTMSNYWNGIDAWSCAEWKVWHQKLEQHYGGTYQANQVWELAWGNSDNWDLGTSLVAAGAGGGALLGGIGAVIGGALGLFVAQYIDCRYDCTFVGFLYSKNIEIGNLLSNTSCNLQNVAKNILGAAQGASKAIKILAPVAVLGAAYWAYKTYIQDET